MARRWLLGSTVLAGGLALNGCEADHSWLGATDPDLARAIAAAGTGPQDGVARAQMPETKTARKPPMRPLDMPPDRSAEIANAPAVARICATVNGEAILEEEVRAACFQTLAAMAQLPDNERRQEANKVVNAALNQIVDREIVLQDMVSKLKQRAPKLLDKLKEAAGKEFERQVMRSLRENGKFKSEIELQDFFRSQGITLDVVRRQWERNFMAMEYLRNIAQNSADKIGHVEALDYYLKHPDEFKVDDNVQWQDLFVAVSKHPSRDAAQAYAAALSERVKHGEDFVTLAKDYDNGDSSLRSNAEGIGRKHDEIKPAEAADMLFKLKDGETTVIPISTGFHVVKVVRREYAGALPFDAKVQKQVKEKLRGEMGQREMKRIVAELKRNAIVEYAGSGE
jgi:parvulin-like peptidyl-prolyl isomerase